MNQTRIRQICFFWWFRLNLLQPDQIYRLSDGKVFFFWQNGRLKVEGNLSPEVVIELLIYVRKRRGDDIGSVHYISNHREMVPLEKVIEALGAHDFEIFRLAFLQDWQACQQVS
ncbi:MAG: hypothetical protein HXS48_27710 [Theionarchaea archaeon]|nr:MAG: hypothetical protein AYK19_16685 [Theionarchaea archaeon DG-70-1]MBU7030750.1 hypothetical protein [Theionarchaea archaeon]